MNADTVRLMDDETAPPSGCLNLFLFLLLMALICARLFILANTATLP